MMASTLGATLVTGASGFLGQQVCRSLLADGTPVWGLTRGRLAPPPGVEAARYADLLDRPAIRSALAGIENVIHLAARVHMMEASSSNILADYRRTNVEGTRVLLEESIAAGVRRFVLLSSVKAVGESTEVPWTEETVPQPQDPYGISKLEAEQVVRELAGPDRVQGSVLRLPLVYGPGMRANILRLFELVDQGIPLPLGSIRNRRSVIFSGNVVRAIASVLGSPAAAGEVFFVRDDRDVSTPELIRKIAKALGRPARLFPVPPSLFRAAGRLGDRLSPRLKAPLSSAAVDRLLGSLVVDASKLTRITGFRPPIALEDGMRETAEWYRGRKAAVA
jgi:nucleoside-diphosphate-sugar epimerase